MTNQFTQSLNQPFTPEDKIILETVAALLPGLSALLGKNCEIVLNSLEDLEHSVLVSINALLSHRSRGNFISSQGIETLKKLTESDSAYYKYFPIGPEGQRIKAVIIPIKNRNNRCIGALSIGINLDMSLADFINESSKQIDEKKGCINVFGGDPNLITERVIDSTMKKIYADPNISVRNKVKEVVTVLYHSNIFKMKNAVPIAAKLLNVGSATIYLHLRELKEKN